MYLESSNFSNLFNMVIDKSDSIHLLSFGGESYIVISDVVGEKTHLVVKLCACASLDTFDKNTLAMGCLAWRSAAFKCSYLSVFQPNQTIYIEVIVIFRLRYFKILFGWS